MAATKRPSQKNAYTEGERKAALELAARVGRRAACRALGIPHATFQRWTEMYPDYWSELRSKSPIEQKTRVAQNLEDLAEAYAANEFEALERAEKLIATADPKELAGLIKAMGASRGVATVGTRGYRGEDHEVIEHRIDFPALEAAAAAILANAPARPALQVENEANDGSD